MTEVSGSCLCGAVRYRVSGPMRPVVYCHCEQCRRTSGHHVAATACKLDDIVVSEDGSLEWYRSSDVAERGFCARCGSNLFYRPRHREWLSIMAGTLDGPTGLDAAAHIFVDSKPDYYAICDGLPQHAGRGNVDLTAGSP
jgi:hypothetical protein